ncbi:unnamed protein product [Ectocarpus fasciculatus]
MGGWRSLRWSTRTTSTSRTSGAGSPSRPKISWTAPRSTEPSRATSTTLSTTAPAAGT